jgi:hypothetical protein
MRVDSARQMGAEGLRAATTDAYLAIAQLMSRRGLPYPARLWNFIPGVLEPLGALPHRYMVFNAGRFDAYRRWFGGRRGSKGYATASGVGHDGHDLVIHCLAAAGPGRPAENPRQIPAYRYARRYGPRPPCFARATVIDHPLHVDTRWILIGGTASVVGEESVHANLADAQLSETFENLQALLSSIMREERYECGPGADPLRFLRHLRVYFVRPQDLRRIREIMCSRFPLAEIEYVSADLCRPDLLVEIEGLAVAERSDRMAGNHDGEARGRSTRRGNQGFIS